MSKQAIETILIVIQYISQFPVFLFFQAKPTIALSILFKFKKMKTVIILAFIIPFLISQGIKFQIRPSTTTNTNTSLSASAQACYANCKSCQTISNKCQQCYDPYFVKAQDGSCQLADKYTLQSSNNQLLAGNAFIYTPQSWGNIKQTDCRPDSLYLNAPLRILGPFSAGTNIAYQRSISVHQYIVLSFGLLKMGWDSTSELKIVVSDDSNNILTSQTIKNSSKIANQILCSSTQIDQRFSVRFQIADISVTTFKIQFSFSGSGSWGVATWSLITGSCDSTCSNCSYSNQPTQCIGCNSFFIMGSNSRCSQCFTGFRLVTLNNGVQSCQKCPIQYQNCNPGQQVCYYNNLVNQLNNTDCTFASGRDFSSTYDVNGLQFPGSLFAVSSKPATYQCESYSIVGLAQVGDGITRIFANMQLHYLISISFNIFIVDQSQATQNNLFIIILDNVILQAQYVVTQGVSNLCGNPQLEALVTFPATKFYPHSKTNNVNLTITSNAMNWGIRNLRVSFQVCDETCLKCGSQGCLQCQGYFTLNNLKCTSCPLGFGRLTINSTNTCIQCPQNCLVCSASSSNNITKTICLQCASPFFLFQQQCTRRTNIADTINIPQLSNNGNSSTWNAKTSAQMNNKACSIDLPLRSNGSLANFTVSQNLLTSVIKINQPHYKKIVHFYLIKIDNWNKNDLLQLYLNDLLVMQKKYSSFGNNICFNSSENDFISYQSIQIQDSNSSLSISFEVVTAIGTIRRFGVSNFQVFPKGCENCNNYPFEYKLDYNYDNSLNVHLQFNRVYVNNNVTLFRQIFWMLINGNKVDYSIIWNNSIIYKLQSLPNVEVINANLTVICKFPQLVRADTANQISDVPLFTARLLQSNTYQTLKVIDNDSSSKKLERYSPPQNAAGVNGMRIFFQVVSRAVIYLGFAFFFIGCQTSCTHFMHNLQKIWLHIFIAALTAPSALRYALVGFAETQGQNIAIHPTSWQSALPTQLYYNTPSYFQQYYTDVGFFRNIYNIAIAFLILIVFSIVANLVLGRCNFSRNFKDSVLWRHLRITFVKRPFFVFSSIVFYQYLSLVLACTLQFTGFMNKTNKGVFGGLNAAGAVVAFIIATVYPLLQFLYLQKKRQSMQDARIQYANRYGQLYYRFLPSDVWNQQSIGITYAQEISNLYRYGQIWWLCIIATLLYQSPQAQCFLLIITHLIHLALILFTSLSNTLFFKLSKIFELAFFVGLQILILVCQSQQDTLTPRGFNTLGSVGIAFIFGIVFLSFVRSIYTFSKIYDEYSSQNIKIRNEDYFDIKGEQPIPSQRDN